MIVPSSARSTARSTDHSPTGHTTTTTHARTQQREQTVEAAAQGRKMGEESRCLRMEAIEDSGTTNMMVLNATAVDLWGWWMDER